jgi:hypothetical protein
MLLVRRTTAGFFGGGWEEAAGMKRTFPPCSTESVTTGLTSDLSYYTLKKRIKELNVPRKKCGDIPSQKDHVPHINLKKFDADALKSDGCK